MTANRATKKFESIVEWSRGFNDKKVWAVFLISFFVFYIFRYEASAPIYEKILISALGALMTPPILLAFLGIPAFLLLFVWTLLQDFIKWFFSWLRR